jgi:hypothetical protein
MEPDAVMCTSCGFNIEAGKAVSAVASKPPPAPGGRKIRPAAAGAGGEGKILFWVLSGVGLVMFILSLVMPATVVVIYGYVSILSFVVWVWAATKAWPDGIGRFLLTFLTPYSLYFIYRHNDSGRLKSSCTAMLITSLLTIIAIVIIVVRAANAAQAALDTL